ncbi:MAG: hypothetical protein ACRCVE_10270 [Plesiomonas sp.]
MPRKRNPDHTLAAGRARMRALRQLHAVKPYPIRLGTTDLLSDI